MDTWIAGVLGGFGASVAASVVFLVLLSTFRPRFDISTEIAKTPKADGTFDHRIKFVNKSRRSCVDLSIRAYIVREWKVPANKGHDTGVVRAMRSINVNRTGGYVPGKRRKDLENRHAQRVLIGVGHIDEWIGSNQEKYILVRIAARDGVTGFPNVRERKFELTSCLRTGTFLTGDSLEIVDWHPTPSGRAVDSTVGAVAKD